MQPRETDRTLLSPARRRADRARPAVADFTAVYLALALDNERALHS